MGGERGGELEERERDGRRVGAVSKETRGDGRRGPEGEKGK